MFPATKFEHCSLRHDFLTRLAAFVEHSAHASRYHRTIQHHGPQKALRFTQRKAKLPELKDWFVFVLLIPVRCGVAVTSDAGSVCV